MLHGDRENPKVISWGNPGVPTGNRNNNAMLAAGRRTNNGSYQRRYVPVITAATADYRVEPVRIDTATRQAITFTSMTADALEANSSPAFAGRVYGVDAGGVLRGWGYNPASIGDARNPSPLAGHIFGHPVPLTAKEDRDAGSRVVTFTKVQGRDSFVGVGQSGNVLALSSGGTLYGTSSLGLDNAQTPATASYRVMNSVSTQAWADFECFGVSGDVMAIRDNGTLWSTSALRSTASSATSQIKGCISAVYLASPFTQSTNASNTISASAAAAPPGGRVLSFELTRKTPTSSYEVSSISDAGLFYTAVPTVTFSFLENANNSPAVSMELLPETGWVQLAANGNTVLALNRGGSTSKVFVATSSKTPDDFMPSDSFTNQASIGVFELRHLPGAQNHSENKYAHVESVHLAKGMFRKAGFDEALSAFFLQSQVHASRSNMLVLGDNQYGQLGVASTGTVVRSPAEVASPDAADFVAKRVACSLMNTFVVREGSDVPGYAGTHVQHLYTAGMPEFSGTTATANANSFSPVAGVNGTASMWEHVFAFGRDFDYAAQHTVALYFASYSTVADGVIQ